MLILAIKFLTIQMKITIVAFDIWGFSQKIVDHLKLHDHEVTFIDTSKIRYTYKNNRERIKNFFSKTFLNKNIKKNYLQNYLYSTTRDLAFQECILIINPGYFNSEVLDNLRAKTNRFIAYNYDSLKRAPLPTNFDNLFDKIFSFDIEDVRNFSYLELLTNFAYLPKKKFPVVKNKAFMILSNSYEREKILNVIAEIFQNKGIQNFEFLILNPALKKHHNKITLIKKPIDLEFVIDKMCNAEILIDLVRNEQTGLSFRIFEAMALSKKIITNNASIKDYDFYNPNNILIIDENDISIPNSFLYSEYQDIDELIYKKYTIDSWVNKIFELNN